MRFRSFTLLVLAAPGASGPPASLRAGEDPRFPVEIQRSSGGREKLGLTKANGFSDLPEEVTFILDPRGARKGSSAYRPGDPALLPLGTTDLKILLEAPAGRPVAQQVLKEVLESFFKLANREDKAVFKTDLKDVLRLPCAPARLLVTVEASFGVRPEGGKTGEAPGRDALLECRTTLKAFKLAIAPDGGFSSVYANLASCELLFEDSAVGRVPLGAYADPVLLARASIIDALRGKLAVSFCMNPGIRGALSRASESGSREKTILGDSIAASSRS